MSDLELALRLKTALEADRCFIQDLGADVERVGEKSAEADKKLIDASEATSAAATKTTSANDALTVRESRLANAIRNANNELTARSRMAAAPVTR